MLNKHGPNIPAGLPVPKVMGSISAEQLGRVQDAYDNVHTNGTREVYRKHWRNFEAWCIDNNVSAKPADPLTVSTYMTERALEVTVATLKTALAAVRSNHEEDGFTSPTLNPQVRRVMKGLARAYARAAEQVAGIDDETFEVICTAAHNPKENETQKATLRRATFDIALIAFMRDAMLRRKEAADAKWQHIQRLPDGTYTLEIPTSKTDQTGEGAFVFLSPFTIQCLADMLLLRGGNSPNPEDKIFRIGERQIANRIKAAAKHAGLHDRFAGHSPRVGMAIDLALDNVEIPALMQAGRWQSERTAARYIRKVKASDNAVARWHQRANTTQEDAAQEDAAQEVQQHDNQT